MSTPIVGKQLLYADFSGESVPQLRYLYAVVPAVFLFVWLGWRVWVPARLRRYVTPATVILLLHQWLCAGVLAVSLLPALKGDVTRWAETTPPCRRVLGFSPQVADTIGGTMRM